ncbi:hypothetical protein [Chitinophaga filiformis]|uniref:GAF domain-containing protein n=1 Tax=Chitinophaga filiformis TaxID=104663 RepID=A0ABY4HT02_CHIFI|nr:hypothetical protein [Chitinophaga filiformis]UPK66904.1 hypothetical protein MYF79_18355 [Chitinophaga filiformis]
MASKTSVSIFTTAITQSIKGKIWKWFLGGIGSLVGVLLLVKNFFGLDVLKSSLYGGAFLFLLFIIRFSIFLAREVIKHLHFINRDSIYGDAIIALKDAFAKVNALQRAKDFSDTEFVAVMVEICNGLQHFFNKKTKSKCSVSIKVPITGNVSANASVQNLCRDSEHARIRDTEVYNKINHTIIGNTPFQKILNGVLTGNRRKFIYINNDINASKDYENTSRDAYTTGILPYESEIVYPLIPAYFTDKSKYDVLGFLCIDCQCKGKFDEKYDVAIIECATDRLYDLIVTRNYLKAVKQTQNEGTAA